ncbi:MAG TPA: hypothetical protein VMX58_04295 [Patescibacteria group bacterium]|nr:hypothetical protein [Patescibacteria group bacterium]
MSDLRHTESNAVRWILKPHGVVAVSAIFVAAVLFLNLTVRLIYKHVVRFDWPVFWPLGMFLPRRPAPYQVALAIILLLLFYIVIRLLQRTAYNLRSVIGTAVVLLLATNLLQGWEGGFVTPIAGGGARGIQCYHDAINVESALEFVRHFEEKQQDLLTHSRTHPPGAVLSIYFLHRITGTPAATALVIACLSAVLSMLFLHGILAAELGEGTGSRYTTLLYMLVPAIQIYFAACIDALISGFLLGALYCIMHRRASIGIIGAFVCICLASFMTFGFLFILPVIVITELIRTRRFVRSAITIALLAVFYGIVDRTVGFNYLASFATAASLENPNGFMLFADPASYIFTRLESAFEIIVFFGPFLILIAVRGFRSMRGTGSPLLVITAVALVTIAAMFLTGAFRTGETARCCLFVYPYLLFPVAWFMGRCTLTQREETVLILVVYAQSVFMQLFGNYFW